MTSTLEKTNGQTNGNGKKDTEHDTAFNAKTWKIQQANIEESTPGTIKKIGSLLRRVPKRSRQDAETELMEISRAAGKDGFDRGSLRRHPAEPDTQNH